MSKGVNKVVLVGNLGTDPEYRSFAQGGAVTHITVATSEMYRDRSGEMVEKTEWHRVTLPNIGNYRMADYARDQLRKGHKVYIEGKIQTRKWTDKNGAERYTTEVVASEFQSLTPRPKDDQDPYKQNNGGW